MTTLTEPTPDTTDDDSTLTEPATRQEKRAWGDLTSRQQTAILVAASIELALTATALVDLARRPADLVRGDRRLWALGIFVQPIGPIAYLAWGTRGAKPTPSAS